MYWRHLCAGYWDEIWHRNDYWKRPTQRRPRLHTECSLQKRKNELPYKRNLCQIKSWKPWRRPHKKYKLRRNKYAKCNLVAYLYWTAVVKGAWWLWSRLLYVPNRRMSNKSKNNIWINFAQKHNVYWLFVPSRCDSLQRYESLQGL